MSSLPVPVSPVTTTVALLRAINGSRPTTARNRGASPTRCESASLSRSMATADDTAGKNGCWTTDHSIPSGGAYFGVDRSSAAKRVTLVDVGLLGQEQIDNRQLCQQSK